MLNRFFDWLLAPKPKAETEPGMWEDDYADLLDQLPPPPRRVLDDADTELRA